jgi:GntR family transcriptional regulator
MDDRVDPKVFRVDAHSIAPLYYQIKQNVRDLIEGGVLRVDQLLPSERELSEHYGVNRLTVRQAIGELVREGLLRRERGVGTFVSRPKLTQALGRVVGFSERVREAGHVPSSRVLAFDVLPEADTPARRLCLESDALVYKLVRLRCSDGEPLMLETAYLPQARFPGLEKIDFTTVSLYDTLARLFNCWIVEAEETLEPVIMNAYEVAMLGAEPNTPGLLVEVVSADQFGQLVEIGKSIVRGDKSRYLFHIKHRA